MILQFVLNVTPVDLCSNKLTLSGLHVNMYDFPNSLLDGIVSKEP